MVDRRRAGDLRSTSMGFGADFSSETFELDWLSFKTLANYQYLPKDSFRCIYFYHHRVGKKAMFGLFQPGGKANIFVVDTVRSNQVRDV